EAEFNEVYLDDVFMPDDAVLGAVGGGWQVAMTTLMNERVSLGARPAGRGSGAVAQLVACLAQARSAGRAGDAEVDRVMRLWLRAEAARLTNIRASDQMRRGT